MFFLIFSFFLMTPPSDGEWIVAQTGIYSPVRPAEIAVNDASETFLLHRRECKVYKYDANGEHVLTFGNKGQGPGEMRLPTSLFIFEDSLYVYDMPKKAVLTFDFEGNYKGQLLFSERFSSLAKTKGGWVISVQHFFGNDAGRLQLKWFNETLSETKVLVDYSPDDGPDPRLKNVTRKSLQKNRTVYSPFNPASTRIHYKVIDRGSRVVGIYPGPRQQMALFDGTTGEVLKVMKGTNDPIPFNQTWGEQQFELHQDRQKKSKSKMPFERKSFYDAPDFFPFARQLWAFGGDHFYILPWTKDANYFAPIVGYDFEGNQVEHTFSTETLRNLVHFDQTHAWLCLYDKEEQEAGIAKVRLENLASFVKTHIPAAPNSRSPSP